MPEEIFPKGWLGVFPTPKVSGKIVVLKISL
jgi:hypothetical protein